MREQSTVRSRRSEAIDWCPWVIFFGSLVVFSIGLGRVHLFDWDEINFAESAREMLVTGNWLDVQVNFETFWEKPPLFIWLQALSMRLFGVSEFAARFPNAIAGAITLVVLYLIGKRERDQQFGLLWMALYGGSFLPFFYFKSGIIDPWFNLFIFLGIYFMARYTAPAARGHGLIEAILSGVFLGLATLTKGPVGFLIFALAFLVILVMRRWKLPRFRWVDVAAFVVVFAVVGGLWFILQIVNGNLSIIQDFIVYQIRLFETQDAGHGGFPMYHFVILLFGVFPASIFALPTMRRRVLEQEQSADMKHLFQWMMVTLWVVLILFSIVRTKIVHYSSMAYFPITFLGTYYLWNKLARKETLPSWVKWGIGVIGIIVGLAVFALSLIEHYKLELIPHIDDPFAVGNLMATGNWSGGEWILGVAYILGMVAFLILEKRWFRASLINLLSFTALFMFVSMLVIVPRVEEYSQNALIEFCKDKQGEDCYIYSVFKSYAPYFYSERQPENNCADEEYLMLGEIDKPTYFIIRATERHERDFLQQAEGVVRLYDKNGFLFYARYPKEEI